MTNYEIKAIKHVVRYSQKAVSDKITKLTRTVKNKLYFERYILFLGKYLLYGTENKLKY